MTSSQVYGNTANNTGTAPGEGSLGGGVFIAGGSNNSLTRSLIVANRAAGQGGQGGGIFLLGVAPVNLSATLVAANLPDNCFPPGAISGCTG